MSNSAGLMTGLANELELRENMVRIGALLYGFCRLSPSTRIRGRIPPPNSNPCWN